MNFHTPGESDPLPIPEPASVTLSAESLSLVIAAIGIAHLLA